MPCAVRNTREKYRTNKGLSTGISTDRLLGPTRSSILLLLKRLVAMLIKVLNHKESRGVILHCKFISADLRDARQIGLWSSSGAHNDSEFCCAERFFLSLSLGDARRLRTMLRIFGTV